MTRPPLQPRYPTAAAIDRLTELLDLPEGGQDWEIEVADPARVDEFLDLYESDGLEDDDERFTLMELIVASYDVLLCEGSAAKAARHWDRLRSHLVGRFDLHGYTVQYWSLPDEDDPENVFRFTSLAREVMEAFFGPRERWPRRPVVVKRFIDPPDPLAFGVALNHIDLVDNRDGSGYTLWWSRYRDRPNGARRFATLAEALGYAEREFGVSVEQWQDV